MSIKIHALSASPPAWMETAINDYAKRLSGRWSIEIKDTRRHNRSKSQSNPSLYAKEAMQLLSKIPARDQVIALDETGVSFTCSDQFAHQLNRQLELTQHIHFILGSPEGLTQPIRDRAQEIWSLSGLTFTHAPDKVILCEQIYRAWSIVHNHPYHNP